MKIVHFTDIHGKNYFNNIKESISAADVVILSGDITHFGHKGDMMNILNSLKQYNNKIFAVTGNCDFPETLEVLENENYSIQNTVKVFNNYQFVGLGGSLPCPGSTPNEYTENEYMHIIDRITKKIDPQFPVIFVTHQPPYNTIQDLVPQGSHTGSEAIRTFILKYQPLVCLCGHIHEGTGKMSLGKTQIVNPGPFRDKNFTKIEIGTDSKIHIQIA